MQGHISKYILHVASALCLLKVFYWASISEDGGKGQNLSTDVSLSCFLPHFFLLGRVSHWT